MCRSVLSSSVSRQARPSVPPKIIQHQIDVDIIGLSRGNRGRGTQINSGTISEEIGAQGGNYESKWSRRTTFTGRRRFSLVNLAELSFHVSDLGIQFLLKQFIGDPVQKLPVLHDPHFQFYALIFVAHSGIPTSFFISRRNRNFVQREAGALRHAGSVPRAKLVGRECPGRYAGAYVGGCKPCEFAQSSMRDPVSARRAFRSRLSFSSPGGSCAARSRASFANEARRSRQDIRSTSRRRPSMATFLDFLKTRSSDGSVVSFCGRCTFELSELK